jgi:hypothetical protein
MAKKIACENCGRINEIFGPKIQFTDINGKMYCEDCVEEARKKTILNNKSDMTDSQKLTGIYDYIEKTYTETKNISDFVNTIRIIMIISVVLGVIAIILNGFAF